METLYFSKALVSIYESTWHHNPEQQQRHLHRHENHKFHTQFEVCGEAYVTPRSLAFVVKNIEKCLRNIYQLHHKAASLLGNGVCSRNPEQWVIVILTGSSRSHLMQKCGRTEGQRSSHAASSIVWILPANTPLAGESERMRSAVIHVDSTVMVLILLVRCSYYILTVYHR
jgi:hypothetical protein